MKNFYLSKKRFFNHEHGGKEKHYFLFPTFFFSKNRKISWDLNKLSVTFVFLNFYYQLNFFTIVKDFSKEIYKNDIANILKVLKEHKRNVQDVNLLIKYLQENNYIITIVKNLNIEHPYCKKTIYYHLKDCDFVKKD